MRRFSQKNSMVTLSEINIVPLVDLTFVLLIIFVITTPLLEQSISLELPSGGELKEEPLRPEDIATVEININGTMSLDKRPMDIDHIAESLVIQKRANPNLVVYIRGDENAPYKYIASIVDRCQKNGLYALSLQTEYEPKQ